MCMCLSVCLSLKNLGNVFWQKWRDKESREIKLTFYQNLFSAEFVHRKVKFPWRGTGDSFSQALLYPTVWVWAVGEGLILWGEGECVGSEESPSIDCGPSIWYSSLSPLFLLFKLAAPSS